MSVLVERVFDGMDEVCRLYCLAGVRCRCVDYERNDGLDVAMALDGALGGVSDVAREPAIAEMKHGELDEAAHKDADGDAEEGLSEDGPGKAGSGGETMGEAGRDGVDGYVPEIDAVGVEADPGDEAVGPGAEMARVAAVEKHQETDADEVCHVECDG
ncbi:MAG: hypothetical protein JWP44_5074, partial [Mucilaginibacter sp.]|nr:hypothetical protein [Mucilaginibacter sp.]